mmetsp:Transcript_12038/g.26750  ORF Transcript_12038/g.26750 Transcript_12038/m.26750 type:complete len:88 (-) Transcript_12038:237-500(-)
MSTYIPRLDTSMPCYNIFLQWRSAESQVVPYNMPQSATNCTTSSVTEPKLKNLLDVCTNHHVIDVRIIHQMMDSTPVANVNITAAHK